MVYSTVTGLIETDLNNRLEDTMFGLIRSKPVIYALITRIDKYSSTSTVDPNDKSFEAYKDLVTATAQALALIIPKRERSAVINRLQNLRSAERHYSSYHTLMNIAIKELEGQFWNLDQGNGN
jgi:hypothetical protein